MLCEGLHRELSLDGGRPVKKVRHRSFSHVGTLEGGGRNQDPPSM